MSEKLVTYEVHQGVVKIGLNDPSRLNVLSRALVRDFNQALDRAEADLQNVVIIIYGHGRAFCAGGDLKEFIGISAAPQDDIIKPWERLSACKLPVIAAVHGFAIGGGCELMLMADYVMATREATFGQPELQLGFIPGCGATQRLAKRMGYSHAFNFIASASQIDAASACAFGLLDKITESNVLLMTAHELALTWVKQGRAEVINLKLAMQGDSQQERQLFYAMIAADHAQQRIQQFLHKKPS